MIDEQGLASYPATATAATSTQISGIAAGRSGSGIVQRIATRKVYQSKSEAERIGSDHAAARVRRASRGGRRSIGQGPLELCEQSCAIRCCGGESSRRC